jgi:hypothetical protein
MEGMLNEAGHALIWMPDRYAMRILVVELTTPTPSWRILPAPITHREPQGYVVHETLVDWTPDQDFTNNDQTLIFPTRIQERQPEERKPA